MAVLILSGLLVVAVVTVLVHVATRSVLLRRVDHVRRAVVGFAAGDGHRRAGAVDGPPQVVELARAFDDLADEIQQHRRDQRVLIDELDEAAEAERLTIAAGIHDETIQNLGAIGIRLQLARRSATSPDLRRQLAHTQALLHETTTQLRELLFDLRPPAFTRLGLAATLRETLEVRFSDQLERWSVVGDLDPDVPEWVGLALYRVVQQALANVRQHARATSVQVSIVSLEGVASIQVVDDGRGFDVDLAVTDPRPGHIGLRLMRDRARAPGGDMTVTAVRDVGTTVFVEVPYRPDDEPVA